MVTLQDYGNIEQALLNWQGINSKTQKLKKMITLLKEIKRNNGTDFKFFLAVSSDQLYVLDSDRKTILESIVEGYDKDGYVCATEDIDEFLDAINCIKKLISEGYNPLKYLEINS